MIRKIVNNVVVVLLFLCCISIVFYRINAFQSILLIIISIAVLLLDLKKFKLNNDKIIFLTFPILLIAIYLYYYDITNSLKKIGEVIILFIIPIVSQNCFNKNNKYLTKHTLLITYSICVSLVCLYIINFYFDYSPHHKYNWYLARFFIEYNLEFHSTYMGVWIGLSILILIDFLLKVNYYLNRLFIILLLIIHIATLLILSTRMAMYSIIIILIINSLLFFNKKQKKYGIVILFTIVSSLLFFTNRYKEDTLFVVKNSIINSPRYPIYYCSVQLLKENFWFGNNPYTLQKKQNDCYLCLQQNDLAKNDTNSHSQYFDYFLKGGFLLFFIFITMLFYKLKYSFQTKNYLYFSICIFFCFAFLTENILSRQYGVFIYIFMDLIFLNSIFNKTHCDNKKEES